MKYHNNSNKKHTYKSFHLKHYLPILPFVKDSNKITFTYRKRRKSLREIIQIMNSTTNDRDKGPNHTLGVISLDIPPSKKNKDNSIIENRILTNNRLMESRISCMNIIKDDGTIITGYAIAHPKRNKDFHNFFKGEISQNEHLVNNYKCALQKDILVQGTLFISLYHICFHSNILGWVTDVVIPFSDITSIEKMMTAYVIPNAIQITTKSSKYFFASFLSRDSVYELLMKIWNYSNLNDEQLSQDPDSNIETDKKSESESEDLEKETTCDCLKNNQHFDNLILDTKFKGNVEKIYNLLYTSEFTLEFLREKNDDVNIGEWTKDNAGKLIRESSYTKRLNRIPGPKATKCYLKDEILHQDFNKYVTVITFINTPDVPSGSTFTVKTRTCIICAGPDLVRLIVTSKVEFSRYSLFKSIIEKESLEGQLTHYKEFKKAIDKYISKNLTEFDSETISLLEEEEDNVKQNPTVKEREKIIILNEGDKINKTDKIRNNMRIPSIETLVIIALFLTLIFNIYILTSIRNVNDKVEFIECQNGAGNKQEKFKFDPLNEMLKELKRRRLSSILDESSWDDRFNEYL